jgi:hypothetical protein
VQTAPQAQAQRFTSGTRANWHDMPKSGTFFAVVEGYPSAELAVLEVRPFSGGYREVGGQTVWIECDIIGWALDRKQAVLIAAYSEIEAAR